MAGMVRMMILLGMLSVAGCSGYEPPTMTDRAAPQYQADLAACQEESVDAVNKRNAKTGLAWISSPVRRGSQIRAAIRDCIRAKAYSIPG